MSEQENLKLVQQFYAAFKTGNINGVLSTLADDIGWSVPGPRDIIPFVGQRQGHEQVAQVIAKFTKMQDAEQFEVQGFVAHDDKVVAFGHYRWRVKSTGHSYESDFAHAFTISHGKVSRFQEYVDTQSWAAAYRTAKSLSAGKINQ
jgi:ketosteroid isomerase-like protein